MLFVLAALCSSVFGHTYLSAVYLNNELLREGDCVRPHPSTAFDSPIPLVTSPDMTCGWLPVANNAANRKCPIAAGSTVGIQWHHNSNSPSDDIIEYTHKGPVMVYLARTDSGAGNVWFKIYEDGFAGGRWGVDRLLDRKGRVDVTIPSDLAPGNYLLRGEVIALHSAYDVNGVQPYVGCVELTISGSGSASPAGVALPGYYKNTDPGMLINIYQTVTSYVIPGPAVYKSGSSSSSSSGSSSSGSSSATSAPTSAPPTAPTTRPASTTAPTSAPVDGSSIKVQVNGGSNVWWFAVDFTGGNEETVKVELADSGSVKNYYIMSKAPYGYYFSQSVQLQLPISIRLTSASGKQVELKNYFNSFNNGGVVDTGKTFGSSSPSTSAPTTKPTSAPVTSAPVTSAPVTSAPVTSAPVTSAPVTSAPVTSAPVTSAPATNAPSTGSKVTFKQNPGSSAWWFAVAVSGIDADKIHGVELKDSDSVPEFACLEATNWGYFTFTTGGTPLAAPVTLRITTVDGDQATATFSSFSGNSEVSGRF